MAEIGLSQQFLRDMLSSYSLFDKPLSDICKKAVSIHVKDCMHSPGENEVVNEDDPLELAIHHFVIGRHQSLLVTRQGHGVTGILRLVDVFKYVARTIQACQVDFKQSGKGGDGSTRDESEEA
jgi:hypothetical protein